MPWPKPREAGLLTPAALEQLLTDALRRQAGRRLLDVAARTHAAGISKPASRPATPSGDDADRS